MTNTTTTTNATTNTTSTTATCLSSSSSSHGISKYADSSYFDAKNSTTTFTRSKNANRRSTMAALVDIEMSTLSSTTAIPTTDFSYNMFRKPYSITKSNSLTADVGYNISHDYQQQQQSQLQQQQYLQQLQHMPHKEKYLKNYIATHAHHPPRALPESLRIIETVIAEDAETNAANTPESQTDTTATTTTNSSLQAIQQMQHQSAANILSTTAATAATASSNSSSLSIYNTALPQSFSFSPSSTMTTTNTSFMTASASVPTSVSTASSNTSCSNKYTRKRERVCHSNSSNTLSKLATCRAYSK